MGASQLGTNSGCTDISQQGMLLRCHSSICIGAGSAQAGIQDPTAGYSECTHKIITADEGFVFGQAIIYLY